MNKKIKSIQAKIKLTKQNMQAALTPLAAELQAEYAKIFDAHEGLQAAIKELESSRNYMLNEYGDMQVWVRASILKEFEACQEELAEYLRNDCMDIDFKNDCILRNEGDYICINDEGDVYHQDCGREAWIIKSSDYNTTSERNALIEAWMQANGIFPGVFKMDRYYNISLINTQTQAVAS